MKRIFWVLGSVAVCIIFVIFLYSWYRVHTSLLLPHIQNNETPATYNLPYETRTFQNADGVSLKGWYVPAKDPKAVIIVVHGYRDVKGTVIRHGKYLHKEGYTTFFIDLASDLPNTKATLGVREYKDVVAAYDYMQSLLENKDKKIGFLGDSMGASASIVAAGKTGKGDFVIASVPYANYKSLFATRLKLEKLPPALLPFVQLANAVELGWDYESYAPEKHIKNIHKPMLLISASKDIKVNTDDAKELFDLANEPKYFWKADAQHDVYKDLPVEYERHILEFLATVN